MLLLWTWVGTINTTNYGVTISSYSKKWWTMILEQKKKENTRMKDNYNFYMDKTTMDRNIGLIGFNE